MVTVINRVKAIYDGMIKMKILDLYESVSEPVNAKFTHGGITYDSVYGLGSVPDNSNVLYLGFAAIIPADDFISLASKADRSETAKELADKILDDDIEIGPPFLSINIELDENNNIKEVFVTGHEGRGRANAIKMLSDGYRLNDQNEQVSSDILVHFFLRSGYRARDLNPSFFEFIKNYGITNQQNTGVVVPTFKKIFHDTNWR